MSFDLKGFQWLIVGAQTGKNPPLPDNRWIDGILGQAAGACIPVFMKDNLKQGYSGRLLQNYPRIVRIGIGYHAHHAEEDRFLLILKNLSGQKK